MDIKDIKSLMEVAEEYKINSKTLYSRLKDLNEGIDYRSLGERKPIILMPDAIEKIIEPRYRKRRKKAKK